MSRGGGGFGGRRDSGRRSITCYNCNGEGHMARDCTEPPSE